jgi:prevent-host-death family protein
MTLVTVTEAKANLSKLIAMVERGEEVVIGRAGKPVVKLSRAEPKRRKVVLGALEGKIQMADDFDQWPEDEARALGMID